MELDGACACSQHRTLIVLLHYMARVHAPGEFRQGMHGLLFNLSGLQHSVVLVHVATPNARLGGSSAASVSYSGNGQLRPAAWKASGPPADYRHSHSNRRAISRIGTPPANSSRITS